MIPLFSNARLMAGLLAGLAGLNAGLCAVRQADELAAAGVRAFEAGRLDEAEEALSQAVKLSPSNPLYSMALGQVYLSAGKPRMAIAPLRKALGRLPGDFDIRYALAQAYQKTDQDLQALGALAGRPPGGHLRSRWLFLRGFSLFRSGQIEEAASLFRSLLADPDVSAPAHFFLGNCYFTRDEYDKAVAEYLKAIALGNVAENRALNAYHYNLGLARYRLRQFEKAVEAFRDSIRLYSTDPLPWHFLGRCEVELAHFEQAIEALENAVRADSRFSPAYYQLARIHARLGDKQRSEEFFRYVAGLKQQEIEQVERQAQRLKLE